MDSGQQAAYQKKLQEQAQKQQVQQQRQAILSQILTPQAKDRRTTFPTVVMKIKTVKPEKAAGIQNSIINAARNGMLKNRLSQAELVNLLEKDSETRAEQKITFKRRGLDDQW